MDYIDQFAVKCLRDAARRHLWATPEWGELFEDDAFALGFVLDELRQAVRGDFVHPSGNFDAALEIADTIMMGFINSKLVHFEKRPQSFRKQPRALKTGTQGRPSSIARISVEFTRRCEAGQVQNTLASESRYFHDWIQASYPGDPVPTAKTIAGRLRDVYNEYRAKNPVAGKNSHK